MKKVLVLTLVFVFLLIPACNSAAKPGKLKVAVLPILDSLPLYVAQQEGYFQKNGVEVELISVASAPERDQLMQSGQIDGMLNEVVSTILYNRDETRVVILRFARTVFPQTPMFRILAAKDSGIQSPADLMGVPIGISQGTVIEYTTDRILNKAGLADQDVKKESVPKIPDRMALLSSGKLKAAVLPDPMASLAMQNGAVDVVDDTSYPEISHSVWSFSARTLKENPESVRRFMLALEQAVQSINKDKGKWSDLLTQLKLVPPPLVGKFTVPDYPPASVPDEKQFADAQAWVKAKGLLQKDVQYKDMVDASYLPAAK
jgi:NitT/TauT family transport system substrate-binding protein